jgi:TolB protein
MAKFFISYRRGDSAGHTGRLTDSLTQRFGRDVSFRDIEDLAPGVNFAAELDRALTECSVMLVVIGPSWVTVSDDTGRRLLKEDDLVRREVAGALAREDVVVIPVLVEDAELPSADELPEDLQSLLGRQTIEISDKRWSYDVQRLGDAMVPYLGLEAVEVAPPARKAWLPLGILGAGAVAVSAILVVVWLQTDDNPAVTTTTRSSTGPPQSTVTPAEAADDSVLAAFASNRDGPSFDVYVTDLENATPKRITSDFLDVQSPTWSPDCDAIAFSASHHSIQADIFRWDAATQTIHRLTKDFRRDVDPVWSPDGTRIYFTTDRDGNNEIYAMQRDGSGVERLTNNDADDRMSSISPDSRQIAFWSDRDGDFDVYVMDIDGSNTTQLTDDPKWDAGPVWSPDGTRLAFWSRRSGSNDVFVMAADGSSVQQLTVAPGDDVNPAWSLDGTLLAFRSDRGDGQEIWLMDADGSNQRNLSQSPGDDQGPSLCVPKDMLSDLPPPRVPDVIEAEAGAIREPMAVREDAEARGGQYVATSVKGEGSASIDVDVAGGLYVVWARVAAGESRPTSADSFLVSIDGGEPDVWDFFEERTSPSIAWEWEMISLRCGETESHECDPWTIELDPGVHTLTFGGGDPGSRLDALFLTSDPRVRPPG